MGLTTIKRSILLLCLLYVFTLIIKLFSTVVLLSIELKKGKVTDLAFIKKIVSKNIFNVFKCYDSRGYHLVAIN